MWNMSGGRNKRPFEWTATADESSGAASKQIKLDSDSPPPYEMKELCRKYSECMTGSDSQEYAEGADVLFSPAAAAAARGEERWNPVVARFDGYNAYGAGERHVH